LLAKDYDSFVLVTRYFLDTLLRHEVTVVDASDLDFRDTAAVGRILGSLKGDRIYKFVKSVNSFHKTKTDMTFDSSEWIGVVNAVEVYKLPVSMRWPTMCCPKQSIDDFILPEFVIRRMNNLHRHRVLASMNRLWHIPKNKSDEKIIWAGSPGCGKTIAVNEIILECVLKLQKLGTQNNQIPNQFFFRTKNFLTRFYFDSNLQKVAFEVLILDYAKLFPYLRFQYESNRRSFVIYEMDEHELDPVIEMPFLLSTSCRDLQNTIKTTWKSSHSTYLYDPMLDFEFNFFMHVGYAFGTPPITPIESFLDRFSTSGGVLRTIFTSGTDSPVSVIFQNNVDHLTVFSSLKECSPFNIIPLVNSIVGVKFAIPLSIEENDNFLLFQKTWGNELSCMKGFYTADKAFFEFCHLKRHWRLEYFSDEITIEIGKLAVFPVDVHYHYSSFMYQIQEVMNIYGGILRISSDEWKLPDMFCIFNWQFFECSPASYELAMTNQKALNKKYASLAAADALEHKNHLISMLPMTSSFWRFQGKYLAIPFHKLSSSFVYRSSAHNCPVYDALTADPASKRLFLFQSTLRDPYTHDVSISAFNSILSNLTFDETNDKIDEIYFYMIASVHHRIETQHFFSFKLDNFHLNACYLKDFASDVGQTLLKKVLRVINSGKDLSPYEVSSYSKQETTMLEKWRLFGNGTQSNCYLKQDDYNEILKFLQVASKIRPYICRAAFMNSDIN
jgi:hypothetical protein